MTKIHVTVFNLNSEHLSKKQMNLFKMLINSKQNIHKTAR